MICPMKFSNSAAFEHGTPETFDCDPECAWLLEKNGKGFCAVSWFCRKLLHDGRGASDQRDGHDFAPWIVNSTDLKAGE